jgi:hypothetical protein
LYLYGNGAIAEAETLTIFRAHDGGKQGIIFMNALLVFGLFEVRRRVTFLLVCDLRWCSLSATRTQTEAAARWISLWLFFIGKPLAAQPNVANWDLLAAQWHF